MNEKLLDYARLIAMAAAQQKLPADMAMLFCRDGVPLLLAELEVLTRVNDRFEAAIADHAAAPAAECDATICSNRWTPEVAPTVPAKKKRRRAKAKRKGAKK